MQTCSIASLRNVAKYFPDFAWNLELGWVDVDKAWKIHADWVTVKKYKKIKKQQDK